MKKYLFVAVLLLTAATPARAKVGKEVFLSGSGMWKTTKAAAFGPRLGFSAIVPVKFFNIRTTASGGIFQGFYPTLEARMLVGINLGPAGVFGGVGEVYSLRMSRFRITTVAFGVEIRLSRKFWIGLDGFYEAFRPKLPPGHSWIWRWHGGDVRIGYRW